MDNIERVNTVYFELYSSNLGRKTINEPDGWNEDFLTLERDKDSKDIRKKIEIDLEFTGEGASYLSNLYYGYGVAPNCLISKYQKSNTSVDEVYNLVYVQRIDLSKFTRDNDTGVVKVKAYEGGLFDLIKNRYDDKVDILGQYSLDGDFIGELKTQAFQPVERKIFLKSLLEGERDRYRIGTGYWDSQFGIHSGRPVPFEIVYKSDASGDIQIPSFALEVHDDGRDRGAPTDPIEGFEVGSDLPLFYEAEESKTIVLNVNIDFKIVEFEERFVKGTSLFSIRYIKSKRNQDNIQELVDFEDLTEIILKDNVGVENSVDNWTKTVELEEGESISIIYTTRVSINSPLFKNGYANTFVNSKATIALTDTTTYAPSIGRVIKPIDLFERLVAKITGKTGLLRSETFGEGGDMEFNVVNNGFFARGFPDTYVGESEEDIAIQFNTSFKEAFEAFSAITPMCWITQKEGNIEVVRVEPEKYTQQNFIGVEIENAEEIKEKCSEKDQFSIIELGHAGDLDYEEVNGLDEPNGKATFSTHLGKSINKTYSKVGKYRFDSQGYELIRRVTYKSFPFEDTDRDEDIWIHDAKPFGAILTHRSWYDDFSSEPKGINFPDSAWNLMFSPMNLLINGHGSSVKRCLYHSPNDYVRFSASNANQNLITYLDGSEHKESGKVRVGELPKQRIKADKVDMTLKVTPAIREQLDGVNEKGVRNIFGLVSYLEQGNRKYGRIIKLTSGENSKLQLIKAGI